MTRGAPQPLPSTAHWSRRLGAAAIDLLLVLFIVNLLQWLHAISFIAEDEMLQSLPPLSTAELTGLAVVLIIAVILCWTLAQGTPGTLLMGSKVINPRTGGAPTLMQSFLRLLGFGLSAAVLMLGFLWMLWDRQQRGWHDLLSGTRVVMDDDARKPLQQLLNEAGLS